MIYNTIIRGWQITKRLRMYNFFTLMVVSFCIKEPLDFIRVPQIELRFSKFPGGGPHIPNRKGQPPPIPTPHVGPADNRSSHLLQPAQFPRQPADRFLSYNPACRAVNFLRWYLFRFFTILSLQGDLWPRWHTCQK